jgi:hypothetical protein
MAKSIIEEALLEAEKLQESLRKNTKEILAATMRQEIDDIVKESFLSEQDEEEVEVTDVGGEELENTEDSENSEDSSEETEEEMGDVEDMEDVESTDDMGDMEDTEMSDMEDMSVSDDEMSNVEDTTVMDMTDEPMSKVTKVFKQLGDNDEIEVVRDGKNINLKDNQSGNEYIIQLEESREPVYEIELDEESDVDEGMCNECGSEMYSESEEGENIYEIEMDETTEGDPEMEKSVESDGPAVEENRQRIKYNRKSTFGNNMKTGGMRESYNTKINQLVSENKKLKTLVKEFENKQDEYKNALKIFRDKLNEIALFNTNLTYATKLFTEHSTTKQEKANILKRFDSVVNLKESKNLYKSISEELGVRTPINESVDKKVNKTISKGSVIKESTVYVDPQIKNIQSLMEKLDGRV